MSLPNTTSQFIIDIFNQILPLVNGSDLNKFENSLNKAESIIFNDIKQAGDHETQLDIENIDQYINYFIDLQIHPHHQLKRYGILFCSKLITIDKKYLLTALNCFLKLIKECDEIHVVLAAVNAVRQRWRHICILLQDLFISDELGFNHAIKAITEIRSNLHQILYSKCSGFKSRLSMKYKLFDSILKLFFVEIQYYNEFLNFVHDEYSDSPFKRAFLNLDFENKNSIECCRNPYALEVMKHYLNTFIKEDICCVNDLVIKKTCFNPLIFTFLIQFIGKICSYKALYFRIFLDLILEVFQGLYSEIESQPVFKRFNKPLRYIFTMELMRILAGNGVEKWEGILVDLLNRAGKLGSCESLKVEASKIFKNSCFEQLPCNVQHSEPFFSKRMKKNPDSGDYHVISRQGFESLSWLSNNYTSSSLVDLAIYTLQNSDEISNFYNNASPPKFFKLDKNSSENLESDETSNLKLKSNSLINFLLNERDLEFNKSTNFSQQSTLDPHFNDYYSYELIDSVTEENLDQHIPMEKFVMSLLPDDPSGSLASPENLEFLVNPKSLSYTKKNQIVLKRIVFSQLLASEPQSPAIGENPFINIIKFNQTKSRIIMKTMLLSEPSKHLACIFTQSYIEKLLRSNTLTSIKVAPHSQAEKITSELENELKINTIIDTLFLKYSIDLQHVNKKDLNNNIEEYYYYLTAHTPTESYGWSYNYHENPENSIYNLPQSHFTPDESNRFLYCNLFEVSLDCLLDSAKKSNYEKSNKFAQLLAQFFMDAPLIPPSGFRKIWNLSLDTNLRRLAIAILSSLIKRSNSTVARKTSFVIVMTLAHHPNSEVRKFFLKLFSSLKGLYLPDHPHHTQESSNEHEDAIKHEIPTNNLSSLSSMFDKLPKWQQPETNSNLIQINDLKYQYDNELKDENLCWLDPYYYSSRWIEDCAGLCFRSILENYIMIEIKTQSFVKTLSNYILEQILVNDLKALDTPLEKCMLFVTLCIRKPSLINAFLKFYNYSPNDLKPKLDILFKEIITQIQPIPYDTYAGIIFHNAAVREEHMILLVEHIFKSVTSQPEIYNEASLLLEALWHEYSEHKRINLILPLLCLYDATRIFQFLSNSIFLINNEPQLRELLIRLLKFPNYFKSNVNGESITAETLLLFLCYLKTPGTEQVKHQAAILDLCVDLTSSSLKNLASEDILPISAIASVTQKIVQDEHIPIPCSFGRLLCKIALNISLLRDFLSLTIIPILIEKKIWTDSFLWKGFKLTMGILWREQKSNLFPCVLRLPQEQGKALLQDLQQQHTITTDLAMLVSKDEQALRSCPEYLRILLGLGS